MELMPTAQSDQVVVHLFMADDTWVLLLFKVYSVRPLGDPCRL